MDDRKRSGGPVPWASVFDPAANARALGDIQARGLHAAGELVERLVEAVDGAGRPKPGGAPSANGADDDPEPRPADAVIDLWADLLRKGIDAFGQLLQPGRQGAVEEGTVDLCSAAPADPLRLLLDDPGGAEAEIWLHNDAVDPIGPICLYVGELAGPEGAVLPGSAVAFAPAGAIDVPGRSSRGITVRVAVADGQAPGAYRGAVQATGAPQMWLPLEVVVP